MARPTTAAALALELRVHAAAVNRRAGDIVVATAARIQADGKTLAPVDTGFLRNSITRTTTRKTYSVSAEIGPEAEYGIYVEEGTYRMAPQPYMVPALERHRDAFIQAIEQAADL